MKHRRPPEPDARIRDAVARARKDPDPNVWMAAFWALSADRYQPTARSVALLAEKLTADRRLDLEKKISSEKSPSKRKRLRAEARQGILPPQYGPAPATPAGPPTDGRCVPLEAYTVDTDPAFFLRRHQAYERARREQTPVKVLVHRKGEPTTIESRVPPPSTQKPRRPRAGGAPRKLKPEAIRAWLKTHGPVGSGKTQAVRAKEMGVTIRTLQSYQRSARRRD